MSWERRVRQRLDALGSAPRTELLHVLMLPDFDRGRPDRQPLGEPSTLDPRPEALRRIERPRDG